MSFVFQVSVWFFLFLLSGWLGRPLGRVVLPNCRDQGAGIGRVLFFVSWGYLFWLVPSLTPLRPTPYWAMISFGIVAFISVWLKSLQSDECEKGESTYATTMAESGFFILLSGFFLLMRSRMGDISGSEQIPDFMILNSLAQADSFPPPDNWFAGHTVNYYYLGQALFLPVMKIVGLPVEYSFNLAMVVVFPLISGVLFSFFSSRLEKLISIWNLTVLAIFWSTWSTAALLLTRKEPFDYFLVSRVIKDTINEHPLFSWFVGDLHAHFISLPVTLAAAVGILTWTRNSKRVAPWLSLFLGALVGLHSGLNTWAVPALCSLAGIGWIVFYLSERKLPLIQLGFFALGVYLAPLAFNLHQVNPPIVFKWVPAEMRSRPMDFLFHWGALLLPFGLLAGRWIGTWPTKFCVIFIGSLALCFAFRSGSVGLILFLLVPFGWAAWRTTDEQRRGKIALAITAFCILLGCEFIYFSETYAFHIPYERMNTVFKFHYVAWGFLLLALPLVWQELSARVWKICMIGWLVAFLFLPVTLATRNFTSIRTIDGLLWLKVMQPGKAMAIDWLRKNTNKDERIIEAVARSQQHFSMLSSFSGRPAILGWLGHEGLWRSHQVPEIIQRDRDIEELYRTEDADRLREIVRKYQVSYISLGERERVRYEGSTFGAIQKLPVAFQGGDQILYSAKGLY